MKCFPQTMLEALADPLIVMGAHTTITRRDGKVLRFVDLDEPSIIGGQVYQPNGGSERTAVRLSVGLGSDTTEITGLLGGEGLTREDVLAGLYDCAELFVFLAFIGRPDLPVIELVRGVFGEMEMDLGRYKIQLNSLTHALSHNLGARTSPTCRAVPGDARCGINLDNYRLSAAISAVVDARTFEINGLSAGELYAGGTLSVAGGAAAGQMSEIRGGSGATVSLYVPLTTRPSAGDLVHLTRGCDRTRETCRKVYDNLVNFQGEPDLPGDDAMLSPAVNANG